MFNLENQRISQISKYRKHVIQIYIILSLIACVSYFLQFLTISHKLAMLISVAGFVSFCVAWIFMKLDFMFECKLITLITGYLMITLFMNFVFNSSYKLHYQLFFHLIYCFTVFEFKKGKAEIWFVIYFVINSLTFYIIEFQDFNRGNEVFFGAQKQSFILSATLGAMVLLFLLMFSYNREVNRINQSLSKLATLDSLTGTYNQLMFQELSEQAFEVCREFNQPLSFIIFDIDDFKQINDQFGHAAGDLVLKKISSDVIAYFKDTVVFGRIGGDEFAILLSNKSLEKAFQIAEDIRKRIEALSVESATGSLINLTISIGVSTSHAYMKSIDDLKREADQAMYLSKRNHKNQTMLFSKK
jgi:diguanylate cyclase (GGDEF)-like protein